MRSLIQALLDSGWTYRQECLLVREIGSVRVSVNTDFGENFLLVQYRNTLPLDRDFSMSIAARTIDKINDSLQEYIQMINNN